MTVQWCVLILWTSSYGHLWIWCDCTECCITVIFPLKCEVYVTVIVNVRESGAGCSRWVVAFLCQLDLSGICEWISLSLIVHAISVIQFPFAPPYTSLTPLCPYCKLPAYSTHNLFGFLLWNPCLSSGMGERQLSLGMGPAGLPVRFMIPRKWGSGCCLPGLAGLSHMVIYGVCCWTRAGYLTCKSLGELERGSWS